MNIFRTKPINKLINHSQGKGRLKKVLGPVDLTALGIGAIIGTGIFVITGVASARYAGPAIVISFILSGLACTFAALSYAEFASMIPVAGSAYTYSYTALGEIWAWILGWNLILEYAVAASAVAIGWSGYITTLLKDLGINLPAWATSAPGAHLGGIINIPAVVIIILVSILLIIGISESAKVNNVIVFVKLSVILLFIFLGMFYVNPINWTPFMPFGVPGILTGAAIVFFAYIGFDAVSTAAEEVKDPQRNLPIGIIASLLISTVLYIIVAGILTGVVPYSNYINESAPVAYALSYVGQQWAAAIVSAGAVAGITSVIIVLTLGQTRIFLAMARDGLIPKAFGEVSEKTNTPIKSTLITMVVTSLFAAFLPISIIAELTNIGTLSAFVVVSISVIILRYKRPDLPRPFKCPWVPVVPILAVIFCSLLMISLPWSTWVRFIIWIIIGVLIYFLYGYRNSELNKSV